MAKLEKRDLVHLLLPPPPVECPSASTANVTTMCWDPPGSQCSRRCSLVRAQSARVCFFDPSTANGYMTPTPTHTHLPTHSHTHTQSDRGARVTANEKPHESRFCGGSTRTKAGEFAWMSRCRWQRAAAAGDADTSESPTCRRAPIYNQFPSIRRSKRRRRFRCCCLCWCCLCFWLDLEFNSFPHSTRS